jgi:hypothetical protein
MGRLIESIGCARQTFPERYWQYGLSEIRDENTYSRSPADKIQMPVFFFFGGMNLVL